MKLQLQNKKVETISYLSKKEIGKLFPVVDYRSVSQVIAPPKNNWVKAQLKDPESAFAKATRQGSRMHHALETGKTADPFIEQCLDAFNSEILVDLEELWGQEEWLAHPLGYKGKFDGVGIFRGKLTLFDHKKTPKRKTAPMLRGWFSQLAAYKQAHEHLYPKHQIEQLAIFNIYGKTADELGTSVTLLTPKEIADFTSKFNDLL